MNSITIEYEDLDDLAGKIEEMHNKFRNDEEVFNKSKTENGESSLKMFANYNFRNGTSVVYLYRVYYKIFDLRPSILLETETVVGDIQTVIERCLELFNGWIEEHLHMGPVEDKSQETSEPI